MSIWVIVAGAIGFTLLTMLLGPWMWSSSWSWWGTHRDAPGGRSGLPEAERKEPPERKA